MNLSVLYFTVTAYLVTLINADYAESAVVVQTVNGKIRGRSLITVHNKTIYAFLEIPYATPPVGPLRFKEAQPAKNWDGILNTTKNTKICWEVTMYERPVSPRQNEDCLYINVYTPKLPSVNDTLFPVLIYIYGGNWAFGDGTLESYDPQLFVEEGIVSVLFNFRSAALGFLSTEDGVTEDNLGIKDQRLAMKWVQKNIHNFGGDPNRVTIMGESGGAVCVTYHLLSRGSAGLFHAAIIESGTSIFPNSYNKHSRRIAFEMGTKFSSDFTTKNSSQELLDLLRTIPARDLITVNISAPHTGSFISDYLFSLPWTPVLEKDDNPKAATTGEMHERFESGRFTKVPTLIGTTSEESLTFYYSIDFNKDYAPFFDKDKGLVNNGINIKEEHKSRYEEELKSIYTSTSFQANESALLCFLSDYQFSIPVIRQADIISPYTDVYFYRFSYFGELNKFESYHHPINFTGLGKAGHVEELPFLLYCSTHADSSDDIKYPPADISTRQRLVRLWSNFIKYHNPTPTKEELLQNVTWPKLTTDSFSFLDIDENLEVVQGYPRQYEKWVSLIDKYYQHPIVSLG